MVVKWRDMPTTTNVSNQPTNHPPPPLSNTSSFPPFLSPPCTPFHIHTRTYTHTPLSRLLRRVEQAQRVVNRVSSRRQRPRGVGGEQ